MNIHEAIEFLDKQISNPSLGLPEEVFLFISRITPMINVDLLIKDNLRGTLLTWREGGNFEPGWHVPGGVLRFKESLKERLKKVAGEELRADIKFNSSPVAVNEIILPTVTDRGHFISLLYECVLTSEPSKELQYHSGMPLPGQWAWHKICPDRLYKVHEIYREFIM